MTHFSHVFALDKSIYDDYSRCFLLTRLVGLGKAREDVTIDRGGTMSDSLNPAERSERMARVRGHDTGPEMTVRRLVHRMGFRYRLRTGTLPGKPDLVFPGRRKVIFVNGCFWHRHLAKGCKLARLPKSRLDFWLPKLEGNRARDRRVKTELRKLGWEALTIWECQLTDLASVSDRMRSFLKR
jgi:DNA mismatch endonuclease, patch repair protein